VQCPFCKAPDTRVIDSRLAEDGTQVRRRRECERCGQRYTTFERAQLQMPGIVKRSGTPEPFDEGKLRRGIVSAVYKRPVSAEQIDHVIESIERKLRFTGEREVASQRVGEWVMEELRDLDHVAYVRFASIYRSFEDVNAFAAEIERLQTLPSAEERKSQMSLIEDGGTRDPGPAKAGTRNSGPGTREKKRRGAGKV
jgi:transcriptional repressor NrdR